MVLKSLVVYIVDMWWKVNFGCGFENKFDEDEEFIVLLNNIE